MQVVFVRHAEAEPSSRGGDSARRLTRRGRAQARATARALRAMRVRLEVVLSSPLVRAVQTAAILAEVHKARMSQEPLLAPPVDATALARRLQELLGEGIAAVALVGHAPSLDGGLARIAAGAEDIGTSLSKAGAACVRMEVDWPASRSTLEWIMHRSQLALLARRA